MMKHGHKKDQPCVYDNRYYLVWAPKYRKLALGGEVQETAKELFWEILEVRDCEI